MNFLPNGAVLPHGLMGSDANDSMAGFNKTYNNNALRMGVIIKAHPVSADTNFSKLTTEYDVLVFEQHEDRGSAAVTYKNCLSAEGLGSVADFFEKALRPKKNKTVNDNMVDTKGQNGAIVLILCLDKMTEKAIIIGAVTHPDRKTTLKDEGPRLEGEYNGVNIKVEKDGSTNLTFQGAKDSNGKVTDKSQGDTVLSIEKDGSYQVKHKTIIQRFDKKGKADLTAEDDISNTTKKNFNVSADENIALKAKKDFSLECAQLIAKATGSANLECQSLTVKSQSEISLTGSQFRLDAQALANIKAAQITLDGLVSLGGSGGQPVLLMTSIIFGIGNLGIPVVSQAITGAFKVTAQ